MARTRPSGVASFCRVLPGPPPKKPSGPRDSDTGSLNAKVGCVVMLTSAKPPDVNLRNRSWGAHGVRDPFAVRREDRVYRLRRADVAERHHLSVVERYHHRHDVGSNRATIRLLRGAQEKPSTVGRPRFGNMGRALVRFREPLGHPTTVGPLPENRQVALSIGLERDALPVSGPHRVAVLAAERQ